MHHLPKPPRRAFTLVELLVVMAIMGVIASIGVYAMQPFQGRSTVTNGGVMLQSWCNAAKARAVRDRGVRGLRFLAGDEVLDDNGVAIGSLVTKCVFIEQPDDILGAGIVSAGNNSKSMTLPVPLKDPIQPPSFLVVNNGVLHEIESGSGTTITSLLGVVLPGIEPGVSRPS